ncbi:MAG TPA: hypothetical protein VHO50_09145 [Bacteroidales bacterium]|nr:hypothetical protein [Bacteroidales bacterium]
MGTKEIKQVFRFFEANHDQLTYSQNNFIRSMKKYYKWKRTLTPRQIECLVSMRENVHITV